LSKEKDMNEAILKDVALMFSKHNVQCFFVGGCVRDMLLGHESDDIDICLVGVSDKSVVVEILSQFTTDIAEEVGNSFPVWIANLPTVGKTDFALARCERKIGDTRTDFFCETINVSINEDLLRRDLTINAIAMNVLTGQIVDPFNGRFDLENRMAQPVSNAFAEDELRVIRAARFISRFELTPSNSLIDICRTLKFDKISNERIGQELKKVLKQGICISSFFSFLKAVNWTNAFAELKGETFFSMTKSTFIGRLVCMSKSIDSNVFESMLNRISFMDKQFCKRIKILSSIDCSSIKRFVRQLIVNQIPFDMLNEEVCPFALSDILELLNDGSMNLIVNGEKLIKSGMRPSKEMKSIIDNCQKLQDDEILNEGNWVDFVTLQ
jgi:hypothetical protein